jgi:hypothetical protein
MFCAKRRQRNQLQECGCSDEVASFQNTLQRVALNRFQSWLWLAAHNATTIMHVATRM